MNNKPLPLITFQILIYLSFLITSTVTSTIPNYDISLTALNPTKTGFMIKGNADGDWFGSGVSTAGDVNGDGYDDIIIGAEYKYNKQGEVYVIYGGPTSSLLDLDLSSISLDPATTGFKISGMTGVGYLGYIVNPGGDLNKDGYDDIIIGAYGINQAYVIYGRETSLLKNIVLGSTVLDPKTTGFTIKGKPAPSNSLGLSTKTAGDIDGDGYDDIIVGAPYYNQGEAYVFYGKDKSLQDNIDLNTITLTPTVNGFKITGQNPGDNFGLRVGSAGDVDGDGFSDIHLATQLVGGFKGAVFIIYGKQRSSMQNININFMLNTATTGFHILGETAYDGLGVAANAAGDVNNDGFDDIIIGATGYLAYRGAVYVIYGGPRVTLQSFSVSSQTINPLSRGFMITGSAAQDRLGFSVNTAGDLNGDGYDDIIFSSYGFNSFQGAVYVIYGGEKADLPNVDLSSQILDPSTTGFTIKGSFDHDPALLTLLTVSTAGDFNGDGYPDIIIGTPYKITTQGKTGAAYVIHSACIIMDGSTCSERNFCKTCDEQANPADTQCQVCPANCQEYLGKTSCQSCDQGYFLSDSQCESCSDGCQKCSDSTACESCKETYFLHESKCFKPCPLGLFGSEGICKECSSPCSSCTSLESCQTCDDGYYLYKSQCLEICPGGTFSSASKCLDCPSHCSSCSSLPSCQTCEQGYSLSNSQCVSASPTTLLISPPKSLKIESTATQRLGSSVTGVGSAVCVGNPTFPLTKLVSKIVQNTRYLELPVTSTLQEIYQTWDADLISWDFPDTLSKLDHFEAAPIIFTRYDIGSPFSFNFWSTIITIALALAMWIVTSLLLSFFEGKESQGKIYSLVEIISAGSLNFALVQAYGCLDDIILYFLLDLKTNPYNSIFAWASFACGVIFLGIGVLFMLMNIFKVRKYQKLKREGESKKDMRELEKFNERNKKWELFYADFNDHDAWSHSFLAFLIVRSSLSSLIIASLHEHILIQTISFLVLDVIIILFLIIKKPFATLRGKLAQYYFEIITLLVHICTFILALQTYQSEFSVSLNETLCTSIIYLNTALVTGTTGFMFIEIYKTISQWLKSQRDNPAAVHPITEEVSDTSKMLPFKGVMNLTTSPQIESHRTEKGGKTEQSARTEKFHLLPGFNQSQNISASGINLQTSEADNSLSPEIINSSDRINPQRKANTSGIARRRLRVLTNQQNKSIFTAHGEEIEVMELEIQ